MATVKLQFSPRSFLPAATNGASFKAVAGTNFPVQSLAFDATTAETVYTTFRAANYGSGNLTLTINWYADTASSGGVVWEAAIAAITPNTDTQDIETDAFATATNVADTHLGTTGQRVHECAVTISNLDSIAANDLVQMRITRLTTDGSDDMTGDALLLWAEVSYSDA